MFLRFFCRLNYFLAAVNVFGQAGGLRAAWARMRPVEGPGGAVVEAACRSFAFVFIHPFGDGNGRIHRLLLHNVLALRA